MKGGGFGCGLVWCGVVFTGLAEMKRNDESVLPGFLQRRTTTETFWKGRRERARAEPPKENSTGGGGRTLLEGECPRQVCRSGLGEVKLFCSGAGGEQRRWSFASLRRRPRADLDPIRGQKWVN